MERLLIVKENFKRRVSNILRKKNGGISYWIEILGGVLIVVLVVAAFNDFDWSVMTAKFGEMLDGLMTKAENLWQ